MLSKQDVFAKQGVFLKQDVLSKQDVLLMQCVLAKQCVCSKQCLCFSYWFCRCLCECAETVFMERRRILLFLHCKLNGIEAALRKKGRIVEWQGNDFEMVGL